MTTARAPKVRIALGARSRATKVQQPTPTPPPGGTMTDHEAAVKLATSMVKNYSKTSKIGIAWQTYLADLKAVKP